MHGRYRQGMALNRAFQTHLHFFFRLYKKELRFLILFLGIFLVIHFVYYLFGKTALQTWIISNLTVKPGVALLNLLNSQEHAIANGTYILSKSVSLSILAGCDGSEGIFILISAILAYSTSIKTKLKGLLCGMLYIYTLNLIRIISLFYTAKYYNKYFNIVHGYIGQTFIIVMGCMFFIVWIRQSSEANEQKLYN
jgi:exosortase family protein XrtM